MPTNASIAYHGPRLAAALGLVYLAEGAAGRVCYAAESGELRDEFREFITPADVSAYLQAVQHSLADEAAGLVPGPEGVPYPADGATFWRLANGAPISSLPLGGQSH